MQERPCVAAFTDTYLPTINGVAYTIRTWCEQWHDRGGRMHVVYPSGDYAPDDDEHPLRSLPFPFYEGFRLGLPGVPDGLAAADVVHTHTPFSVGVAGCWLARREGLPLVASYHTPTGEYANYLVDGGSAASAIRAASERWERWFLDRADLVVAPSESARRQLRRDVGVATPVEVVPNGVDVDRFRPVAGDDFRRRHDLPVDRPLIGYTGRHGYEKRLEWLVAAAVGLDATVVLGGDGPAREDLESLAAETDADVRFLGFLDREELPAFYSALDVFAFPSPVETQGLVALEANACGTPVAGVDHGALADTVEEGVTGYKFPPGDVEAFRTALRRTIAEREELSAACLDRREELSVDRAIDRLEAVYDRARNIDG